MLLQKIINMDSRVQIFSNYIEVTAPSNIAFVKYWGKKGNQLPANPSLSMTLKNSKTIMEVGIKDGKSLSSVDFEFFNEEKMKVSSEFFSEKIQKYFQQLERNYGELPYQIKIKSYNTFPHSCGIASSASSFACLAAIYFYLQKKDLQKKLNLSPEDLNLISDYARQGSGSSCRSILPGFNLWGNFEAKTKKFGFSGRDDYAVNLNHIVSI